MRRRRARSTSDVGFSWLDFKLGFRMLARYPGLTAVGGVAMAFGVWIGACTFELSKQWMRPSLGLEDADRIVGLHFTNTTTPDVNGVNRATLRDFIGWRDEVESVEGLSAFRTTESNLIMPGSGGDPVQVAEITACASRVARVPPHLGRFLVDADEQPGAPPVVVLGHEVWRERFAADPAVVGRTVRLESGAVTVVGVMPPGFAFPVYHEAWTPLPTALPADGSPGPRLHVFGRLSDGMDLGDARAELSLLGERSAIDSPGTHQHLRPQVVPYVRSILPLHLSELAALRWINLVVVLLVALVCGNVALLMFARASTRESEYWVSTDLSPATFVYAATLTLLGAAIAGVLPALRVTRALGTRLRQAGAGGGGPRFGGFWTVVIVAQVAVSVTFPVGALFLWRLGAPIRSLEVGFAEEEYLSVELVLEEERTDAARLAKFRSTLEELERRLSAEPAVAGVTFADRLPRMFHREYRIDVVEDVPVPSDSILGQSVKGVAVDLDYHELLGAPIRAGRAFHAGDLEPGHRVVIVNQSFVHEVLGGRNAIGRRVRFLDVPYQGALAPEPGPWYEIVGVVGDLGMYHEGGRAGLYHPLATGSDRVPAMVKVRGDPAAFASRLRAVAHALDPTLRLNDLRPLSELGAGLVRAVDTFIRSALVVSAIALLLSLASISSVMAFAVSRRTREIGVRVALGASAHRLLLAVFRRPLIQVTLGVVTGGLLVTVVVRGVVGHLSARELGLVAAYAALMMAVCMLACVVPTLRALRIEPTEALREET